MKRVLFLSLLTAALLLASCGSESDIHPDYTKLPENVSQDFSTRCPGFTIKSAGTYSDFYHSSDNEETFIRCTDTQGNECVVSYTGSQWNRTVRTLTDEQQLPTAVQKSLTACLGERPANDIYEIKEADFAGLKGKEYIIRYHQDTPLAHNCVHTLMTDADGTVLRLCTYPLNNPDYVFPLSESLGYIARQYSGADILGYINDLGDDEFIIRHDGVMKTVLFNHNGIQWKSTSYPLQPGMTVPQRVLQTLDTIAPGFTYTDVTVIESEQGTSYAFTDNSKADHPGHTIGDYAYTE